MAGNIVTLTKDNFEAEVLNEREKPVLVDFWASWCGPCKALAPIIEEVAEVMGSQVKIAKLSTEDCPDIAGQYNVMSIPTLVIFKNGEAVAREIGLLPKDRLESFINDHI